MKKTTRKNAGPRYAELRDFWERMPWPVLAVSDDDVIQYLNPAFSKLSGFSVDELSGQTPPYSFWSDNQQKLYQQGSSLQKKGGVDWQLKNKNGTMRWAEGYITPVRETDKAGVRWITLTDITERKRLEEALGVSEENFKKLFDAIPIPLSIASVPENRFVDVNKSFLDIGGLTRDEVIGKHNHDLEWKDAAEAERVEKAILNGGRTADVEINLLSKSGKLHTSILKAEIVELNHQRFLVAASIDITERKRAEKALQESEARFRMLSENSLAGIFIFRDGRFAYVNPAFAEMLGRTRDELTACDLVDIVHPEDLDSVNEANRKRLMGEQNNIQYGFRCLGPDGKTIWLEALSARFEDEKHPALLGTVLDVTEPRKVKEEADRLQQAIAHVSRVNTLGEVAASIAHELNQPLTAIMANAQTAIRIINKGEANSQELREILEDIASDDRRAGNIIRRMREPLKRGQLTLERLDVNNLINEIYPLVRTDATIAGVTIELKLGCGLPMIKGDRTQLQQVLLNLLVNALDAVKDQINGQRWIELRSSVDNERLVKVEVSDSGPGIKEINREHLFEPLWTTKPDGLGVGLSISKHLIQDHGGEIWQENRVEGGSRFIFTLPIEPEAISN
jgi:PAS domain S-box-containing protein